MWFVLFNTMSSSWFKLWSVTVAISGIFLVRKIVLGRIFFTNSPSKCVFLQLMEIAVLLLEYKLVRQAVENFLMKITSGHIFR